MEIHDQTFLEGSEKEGNAFTKGDIEGLPGGPSERVKLAPIKSHSTRYNTIFNQRRFAFNDSRNAESGSDVGKSVWEGDHK